MVGQNLLDTVHRLVGSALEGGGWIGILSLADLAGNQQKIARAHDTSENGSFDCGAA